MTVWSYFGFILIVGVLAGALYAVGRHAAREGLLLPVAVGFGIRLVVVAAAHITSLATGHHGFFYFDDAGYADIGRHLAHGWAQLAPDNVLHPHIFGADKPPLGAQGGPLFYQLLAGVFLVSHNSVIAMKLVNLTLGTTTVLLSAILARRTIGPQAARPAAWVVALAPTIVWWIAPMMREALTNALAIASLLAATYLPRWRAMVATTLLLVALALTRSTVFLAIGAAIGVWLALTTFQHRHERLRPYLVALAVVGLVAAVAPAIYLSTGSSAEVGTGVTTAFGSYQEAYGGGSTGAFESNVFGGITQDDVATYPAAVARFFLSPRAWAFADEPLDWYQPLYPPMWLWYLLIPTALIGVWRLRRRASVILLALPPVILSVAYAASLAGGVRQRSAIEPLLALLVVAGLGRLWVLLLSGGAVFVVLAPFVAVDLGVPAAGVAVAAAGALLMSIGWTRRGGTGPAVAVEPSA